MPPFIDPVRNWLLDVLFPPRCAGCPTFCRKLFCRKCAPTVLKLRPPYCRVCAEPFDPVAYHDPLCLSCRSAKTNFDFARAAWLYEGAPRGAIHRLKYGGKSALAARLAPVLSRTVREEDALKTIRFDCVAPVPLHARRERKRGFNQSELLARAVADELGVALGRALERTRATPPQVGLNLKERQVNVRGAFALSPGFELPPNANILLVDDVFTTGATLRECATVLKRAGAGSVCAVTLARQSAPNFQAQFEPDDLGWLN
ncbi:hypothetical protein IAD21_01860 [Abditibacteriota bacterium]|nr:hypothetical protein IAD21_01860 [Abditibacteriota bacterium]